MYNYMTDPSTKKGEKYNLSSGHIATLNKSDIYIKGERMDIWVLLEVYRPFSRKRHAKRQNGCLRRSYK